MTGNDGKEHSHEMTTATSRLLNPIVPEPSSVVLVVVGATALLGIGGVRRFRDRHRTTAWAAAPSPAECAPFEHHSGPARAVNAV
jgi:hypothetical protein